ncbi:MAG: hypothetical protein ACTSPV_17010, partial [Candidatus Hodarchaeales archaeon]
MFNLNEKINEFKLLIVERSSDGKSYISKHKLLILVFYFLSFIAVFYHFATLDNSVIQDIQYWFEHGEEIKIPSSPALSIGMIFYLYISLMAIVTLFTRGRTPNFLQKPQIPQLKRKYVILGSIAIIFFSTLTLFLLYLFVMSTFLMTIYLGPVLFYLWMFLEPFFLLNGILIFIDIIDTDYPLEGYTQKSLGFLIFIFILGLFGPSIMAGLLGFNRTSSDFIELFIGGFKLSLYKPAIISFSRTLSSVIFLSILFMIVWALKDKFYGRDYIRERKKGMLPWFVAFTMIFLSISIIPIIATTTGD